MYAVKAIGPFHMFCTKPVDVLHTQVVTLILAQVTLLRDGTALLQKALSHKARRSVSVVVEESKLPKKKVEGRRMKRNIDRDELEKKWAAAPELTGSLKFERARESLKWQKENIQEPAKPRRITKTALATKRLDGNKTTPG